MAESHCWPAVQRVLGIACGVILLEITAILVFPRSATQVAVEKMGSALQKLAALNRMTWIQGPWQASQTDAAEAPAKGSRYPCSAACLQPQCIPLQQTKRAGAVTVHHLQAALPANSHGHRAAEVPSFCCAFSKE